MNVLDVVIEVDKVTWMTIWVEVTSEEWARLRSLLHAAFGKLEIFPVTYLYQGEGEELPEDIRPINGNRVGWIKSTHIPQADIEKILEAV